MPTSPQIADPSVWGVVAHGAELVIDPPYNVYYPGGNMVIDVENDPDGSCAGIGITADGEVIHFFTAGAAASLPRDYFKSWRIVGHNVKYDVQMMRRWGFEVSPDQIVWDTQLAEYVKDSSKNRYGLKSIVKEYFGAEYPEFEDLVGVGKKQVPISTIDPLIRANYCGSDVLWTHKTLTKQLSEMTKEQVNYMEAIELPTQRVILEMEERGVRIDANYIRDLDARFGDEIGRLVDAIRARYKTEINLNSHQQIKQLVLEQTGLSLQDTTAETLEKLEHIPLIKDILRYRKLSKLRGTYTHKMIGRLDKNSRLHARFNQTVTITGRLSSSDPNLQNIPTRTEEGDRIRRGFIAEPGFKFVCADYSQIEPRLMAHFSQDPIFIKIFQEDKSIYEAVIEILDLVKVCGGNKAEAKRIAKIMWLALAYNAGAFKLSKSAGISITQAQGFIDKMRQSLSGFFFWKDKVIKQVEIDGGVTTLFGRFIPITAEYAHLGPNYMVQGSASEVNKLGLIASRHLNPLLNVHDEIDLETQSEDVPAELSQLMSSVVSLTVPIKVTVGVGGSWADAKN